MATVRSPARRPLTRFTRIGLVVVLLLVLVESAALAGRYLLVTARFVSTDNAQVDGRAVDILAPVDGELVRWELADGTDVREREVVGRIRVGNAQRPVRAPGTGRIVRTLASDGQWVTAGTKLATAYAPGDIHVTARVGEHDLGDVRLGAAVDITVDAYPNAAVTGVVTAIQGATAATQAIYPNPEDDPTNPQPTEQYVPVRIALVSTGTAEVSPGMNATVAIHRPDR